MSNSPLQDATAHSQTIGVKKLSKTKMRTNEESKNWKQKMHDKKRCMQI